MLVLRQYQSRLFEDMRDQLARYHRVLVVLPTGGGKTAIAAHVALRLYALGKKLVFLVHRDELLTQASLAFQKAGVPHGLLRAGQPTPIDRIVVASVHTLANRIESLPAPDLLFIDEAHHAVAGTWLRVIQAWSSAKQVGLTATPERLDGRGLGDIYRAIVLGPSTSELIALGYLAPFRAYAPSVPDLKNVRTTAGEFNAAEAMDKPTITGDIVAHYQRLASGRRSICFAAGIEHSRHLIAAFNEVGVPAEHVDGSTDSGVRRAAIARFAAGDTLVLSNVDLFSEGFDVPAVEAVICGRPTQSLGRHLQMLGRALRLSEGKTEAIILDHAGNLMRHGLPDEERIWSLESVARKKGDSNGPAIKQCPECYAVHKPATQCPECGHIYETTTRTPAFRKGDLVEFDRAHWAAGLDIANAKGRDYQALLHAAGTDLDKLREISRARGYRRGWPQRMIDMGGAKAPQPLTEAGVPWLE